ncbi:MAG: PDZ domain-containing protein [Chitinophagales bacterium]
MKLLLLSTLVMYTAANLSMAQVTNEHQIIVVKEEITQSISDSGQNDVKVIQKKISTNTDDGKVVITTKIKNGDHIEEKTTIKELDKSHKLNSDSLVNEIMNSIGEFSSDSLIKMLMLQGSSNADNLIWINQEDDEGNWININDLEEIDEIQLLDHKRPFLGVILDEDGTSTKGVRVISVIENSAAAVAGIEKEDIITEINGNEINQLDDLVDELHARNINEKITIKVNRAGEINVLEATLKCKAESQYDIGQSFKLNAPACCENAKEECKHHQRSYTAYMTRSRPKLGVYIEDLDAEMVSDLKIKGGKGVLITKVLDATTAKEMGLKLNDVIVKLNTIDIEDVQSLHKALEEQELGSEIQITYYRYGKLKTTKGKLFEFNNSITDFNWKGED